MQVIETKYHEPAASIIATTSEGVELSTPYRAMDESNDAHAKAAKAMMEKMGWYGEMVGGHAGKHSKDGMVWVFLGSPIDPRIRRDTEDETA